MSKQPSAGQGQSGPGGYASPACLAHEIDPAYQAGASGGVPDARMRQRLRALRQAGGTDWQARIATAIGAHLHALIAPRVAASPGMAVAGYRPGQGAPDLRPLLSRLAQAGAVVVMPDADRGDGKIGFPPGQAGPPAAPTTGDGPGIALIPLLGWDDDGFGLEEGDSEATLSLARMAPRALMIGVALQAARIGAGLAGAGCAKLDVIVTEAGVQVGGDRAP